MLGKCYFESQCADHFLKGRKPLHYRRWLREIRRREAKGRLLDVGCGRGYFLEFAARHFASCIGMDISKHALAESKINAKGLGLLRADASHLPFRFGSFDTVTCFDVLEHLYDPRKAIADIARILADGGILAIMTPNPMSLGRGIKASRWFGFRDPTHVSMLLKNKWTDLLSTEGLQVTYTFYTGLWDSPYLSYFPTVVQHLMFKVGATILFWIGLSFSERLGEDLCIVARKRVGSNCTASPN